MRSDNADAILRGWVIVAACAGLAACGSGATRVVSAETMRPAEWRSSELGARGAVSAGRDWHRIATALDRGRLRGWRDAWIAALAQAGRQRVSDEPALFDPDRVLDTPLPPPGDYRCRTFKLGARNGVGLSFVAYDWFACRIAGGEEGRALDFTKIGGSQRPVGRIFADNPRRGIFLGTMELGDETRPMAYGRDANRDMAGLVERIGPRRWRLVLPYPRFESTLDVIELVPAG